MEEDQNGRQPKLKMHNEKQLPGTPKEGEKQYMERESESQC